MKRRVTRTRHHVNGGGEPPSDPSRVERTHRRSSATIRHGSARGCCILRTLLDPRMEAALVHCITRVTWGLWRARGAAASTLLDNNGLTERQFASRGFRKKGPADRRPATSTTGRIARRSDYTCGTRSGLYEGFFEKNEGASLRAASPRRCRSFHPSTPASTCATCVVESVQCATTGDADGRALSGNHVRASKAAPRPFTR